MSGHLDQSYFASICSVAAKSFALMLYLAGKDVSGYGLGWDGGELPESVPPLYLERLEMAQDCIFCRIVRGEIPSTKVYEDDSILAFRDINPAAPVHILVIPKRHVARLSECGPEERDLVADVMLGAGKVVKAEGLDSFRLIVNDGAGAGQTVFHLHAHILSGAVLSEKLV